MNPPRWETPYADGTRAALVRMVEEGGAAAPVSPAARTSTVRLVVAIVIALLVVVPASVTAVVLASRAGPAGGGTPVVVSTAPTRPPVPTPSATATRPASAGCAPTAGGIPAGADTGVIDDVDGDHRPDTEWAVLVGGAVEFGITTASGATVSGRAAFAGGGDRTFVVGHLANGVVVVIPSEGRTSDLVTFGGCALHQTEGTNPDLPSVGDSFTLYSQRGGGSAMCLDGELYAISTSSHGTGAEDVIARRVEVSADGMTARLTDTRRTIATRIDDAAAARYEGISCGTSPVLRPTQAP